MLDAEAADAARLKQSILKAPSKVASSRKTQPTSPQAHYWRVSHR